MIAFLITDRCVACDRCIEVCPGNVFDVQGSGPPTIARPEDCSTCFLCELYCKADALYVAPDWDRPADIDLETVLTSGTLGQYRKHAGWDEWANLYPNEQSLMETVFRRAAEVVRPSTKAEA
jgi:NAD-dependent dihydropyrimidine dehydrogenase PreA subunit